MPIIENAGKLCRILSRLQVESMGEGIPVQDVLQRYSSANLLSCIFDCPELAVSEGLASRLLSPFCLFNGSNC